MNYYGGKDLADAFRTVRKNTLQIAEEIPEDKYNFSPAPGSRTVGELLVHIAVTPRLQYDIHGEQKLNTLEGFDFFSYVGTLQGEERQPRTKAQIIDLLKKECDAYCGFLEAASDAFLGERVIYPQGMQPPSKTRFEMLMAAKEHEMHHRGQLMLIERQIGITPHLTRQFEAMAAQMQQARTANA